MKSPLIKMALVASAILTIGCPGSRTPGDDVGEASNVERSSVQSKKISANDALAIATMETMIEMAIALENYAVDRAWYPSLEEIQNEKSDFRLKYTPKGFSMTDAWGRPIAIRTSSSGRNPKYGNRADEYQIQSGGANGVIETNRGETRANSNPADDLILKDGKWIRWWQAPAPKHFDRAHLEWWPRATPGARQGS